MIHKSGFCSATSESRPRTARPTRNRFGVSPSRRPNAVPSASRCGPGKLSTRSANSAQSWCSPAWASSISDSTPAARTIRKPDALLARRSSSAVFPIPASPRRMSARLCPVRTRASRSSRTSHSGCRPRSLGCIPSPSVVTRCSSLPRPASTVRAPRPQARKAQGPDPGPSTCATGGRSAESRRGHQTTVPARRPHMAATTERSALDTAIRPFTIEIPQADLDDLRARLAATRWPEKEPVDDLSQGVPLALVQKVARYWHDEYDWRKCEARLNAYPQFITEIDDLDIHFVHVRSKHEDAVPLILCHGWPGSFIEQMKVVDRLTDPTAHGATASDAFHVVIPNMPGYGFSGKPDATGWDPIRIGRAWVTLMKRLGYSQFVAAGGDWGGVVVDVMAGGRDAPAPPEQAPPELLGIHTNFAGVIPPEIDHAAQTGSPQPSDLSGDEQRATEQLGHLYPYAIGLMMALRAQ